MASEYMCPFLGCTKTYSTTSGIRKHWESPNGGHEGEVPKLVASELRVVPALELTAVNEAASDFTLINMMGLTDGNVDTRSAGRFARASRLAEQQAVTVTVEDPNPWKDAVQAFFSTVRDDIASCSVHSKLILSDSGKMFAPVNAARENYR
jgi:hypothetical protein